MALPSKRILDDGDNDMENGTKLFVYFLILFYFKSL